jgi:type IV pilus assembly protein PilO
MAIQDAIEQIKNMDLNDIDWSRVGVWPLLGRVSIFFLAVFTVVALAAFLFINDWQTTLERENKKEEKLKNEFQFKVSQAAALDQYRNLMEQMGKDFEFLVNQLPKKTQVPGLLDDIDEKARLNGLEIVSVKLQPEQVSEFYVTLLIEIVVTGFYHEMGNFVSDVANMSRIVTLHDYKISKKKKASSESGKYSKLRMEIVAKTYRSIDEQEE